MLFIDYGNYQEVCPEELYELPQQPHCLTAGLAFECVMYGVKPSNRQQTLGTWSEQVNESFRRWTQGIMLFCEVSFSFLIKFHPSENLYKAKTQYFCRFTQW